MSPSPSPSPCPSNTLFLVTRLCNSQLGTPWFLPPCDPAHSSTHTRNARVSSMYDITLNDDDIYRYEVSVVSCPSVPASFGRRSGCNKQGEKLCTRCTIDVGRNSERSNEMIQIVGWAEELSRVAKLSLKYFRL